MFAVKGWSVSADKLKVEIDNGTSNGAPAPDSSGPPKNKKRKRPGNAQSVTADNLGDLWEKVIEKKPPVYSKDPEKARARREKKKARRAEQQAQVSEAPAVEETKEVPAFEEKGQAQEKPKTRKTEKSEAKKEEKPKGKKDEKSKAKDRSAVVADAVEEPIADGDDEEWGGLSDGEPAPAATKTEQHEQPEDDGRKKKKQKLDKKPQPEQKTTNKDNASKPADKKPPQPTPPAPAAVKLTPLQASMREKLVSARFRHLNETLYTRPSAEAFQLFDESPEMFSEYHEGFRRQVEVWPENPVDGFIADIEARAKVRAAPHKKQQQHDFANPAASIRLLPLPRNLRAPGSACTIADLGCGDAALAARLLPAARKLRVDIKSFDLQTAASPLITRADIANLPLADGSVDVAIFCLALMGTNWLGFIEEAYRILRWKGELWIAEIKSRFANPATNKKSKVVAHSVGNRRNPGAGAPPPPGKKSKAARDAAEAAAEADDAALAVAVDGAELRRQETDVSAFVDALRARGFLLHKELGAGAVDLSNKMFVRMHFVKAAPATRGKCVTAETAREIRSGGQQGAAGMKPRRFAADNEEEEAAANEAAILKPCVYKLR